MITVAFRRADDKREICRLQITAGAEPEAEGSADWIDYSFTPHSERLGRSVSFADDPEEWARALPAAYADTAVTAAIVRDTAQTREPAAFSEPDQTLPIFSPDLDTDTAPSFAPVADGELPPTPILTAVVEVERGPAGYDDLSVGWAGGRRTLLAMAVATTLSKVAAIAIMLLVNDLLVPVVFPVVTNTDRHLINVVSLLIGLAIFAAFIRPTLAQFADKTIPPRQAMITTIILACVLGIFRWYSWRHSVSYGVGEGVAQTLLATALVRWLINPFIG